MATKFSEKLHLRVPSKRVAMASRKVFCGARRPFITGIFTLMWDRQLLAEGHTIPGHSVWLLGGPRSSKMAPWVQQSGNVHLQPLCATKSKARSGEAEKTHPNTCGSRFRCRNLQWVQIVENGSATPRSTGSN